MLFPSQRCQICGDQLARVEKDGKVEIACMRDQRHKQRVVTPGNGLLTVSLTCPTTAKPVRLQTLEWGVEIDGENKIVHYRAQCSCGAVHEGFMTERFVVRHASVS
jgi:hypothetical protein